MANDTPTVFDPRNLFFFDSHGAAIVRNNTPAHEHGDQMQLKAAREYVATNGLDHGHLVVERAANGQYCWATKIRGMVRWRSPSFSLTSGKFKEGDTAPFKS